MYQMLLTNCDRHGSRGISQVSRNQSGLLNWHNMPTMIMSNKTVKVNGYF